MTLVCRFRWRVVSPVVNNVWLNKRRRVDREWLWGTWDETYVNIRVVDEYGGRDSRGYERISDR